MKLVRSKIKILTRRLGDNMKKILSLIIVSLFLIASISFGQAFSGNFAWTNYPTLFARNNNGLVKGNLFTIGDTVILSNATVGALVQVYDYRTNLVASGTSPLSIKPSVGWYMAQSSNNGGDRVAFAVLPTNWKNPPVWWGDDIGLAIGAPDYGVTNGFMRLMGGSWYYPSAGGWYGETSQGIYNWGHFINDELPYKSKPGVLMLTTFWIPPYYTNSVASLVGGYTNAVKAICQQYYNLGFNIVAIEPFNEPNGPLDQSRWPGVTLWYDTYAALASNAYNIAKTYWPNVKVAVPTLWTFWADWDVKAVADRLPGLPLVADWHDYDADNAPDRNDVLPNAWPIRIVSNAYDRAMIYRKAAGMTDIATPAYITEFQQECASSLGTPFGLSYATTNLVDAATGANRIMKLILMNRAANVWIQSQNNWYAWDTNPTSVQPADGHAGYWFEPGTRGPQRKGAVFLTMLQRLKHVTNMTCTNIAGVWTVTGLDTNLNQQLAVTWKTEGTGTGSVPPDARDVWGNLVSGSLGDEPVFVYSTSASPCPPPTTVIAWSNNYVFVYGTTNTYVYVPTNIYVTLPAPAPLVNTVRVWAGIKQSQAATIVTNLIKGGYNR